jgi:Domain of unknown function (DUF4430)
MRLRARPLIVAAALAATALLGGCGFGAGPGTKDASVEVTSDFGSRLVGSASERDVPGAETVMSLLERHFKVSTRYGGGFVQSIDGHAGDTNHLDWFYYVNGILAPKGAAATDVHKGDHVWWDLHSWAATQSIPAVVGSYPEPFTNGIGGQEFPTLLECATNFQGACDTVGTALHRAGVKAGPQVLGTGSGSDSLAVVIGTWNELQGIIAAELIAGGPADSGVYAQFVGKTGQEIELDNPLGDVVKTLSGSVGMIAATDEATLGEPTWFVTGTDAAAVDNAAKHFNAATLHDHFAVVLHGNHVIPVPLTS